MRRIAVLVAILVAAAWMSSAQGVSEEYRVKAAYLYNFLKYIELPPEAGSGPLTICVAGRNPFGMVLHEMVRGETVNGRAVDARVILEPERGCHVLFIPDGAAQRAYLRAATGRPVLTVGESRLFINQGGIVSFYLDRGNVRFEINPGAAERAGVRISARLLQLARIVGDEGRPE